MAHNADYTRIWAEETDGLGINEVAAAVGSLSLDVGTLCSLKNNINKWARYKPFRFAAYSFPSLWGGRMVTRDEALAMIAYGLGRDSSGYLDYLPPRGETSNEPFRLLDFDGYNKNAVCPVKDIRSKWTRIIKPKLPYYGDLVFSPAEFLNSGTNVEMNFEEIFYGLAADSLYMGLLFVRRSDGYQFYQTFGNTVTEWLEREVQSTSIDLSGSGWEGGDEIDVYLYAEMDSSEEKHGTPTSSGERLAPDINHGHAVFSIVAFNIAQNLTFQGSSGEYEWDYDKTNIRFTVIRKTNAVELTGIVFSPINTYEFEVYHGIREQQQVVFIAYYYDGSYHETGRKTMALDDRTIGKIEDIVIFCNGHTFYVDEDGDADAKIRIRAQLVEDGTPIGPEVEIVRGRASLYNAHWWNKGV